MKLLSNYRLSKLVLLIISGNNYLKESDNNLIITFFK